MIIDSHLHVWDRSVSRYDWITDDHAPLTETHTPSRVAEALASCRIDQVVLVQAEDTVADTQYMLDTAQGRLDGGLPDGHPTTITGVVGWVPLDRPGAAAEQLEQYQDEPLVKGVRHLIHGDPRAEHFLDDAAVAEGLRLLSNAGLVLDLPDAWPRYAHRIADTAARHPDLTIVVDHLAKPPADPAAWHEWADCLRAIAAHPNTVTKLSGLHLDGIPYTAEALRPSFEVALEAFGPSRMMYGGDWPMTRLHGGYVATFDVLAELIGTLTNEEAGQVWAGTAQRTYRL